MSPDPIPFVSTRDGQVRADIDRALRAGLAPDGGLFVPLRLPRFDPARIAPGVALPECARDLLAPFFAGSKLAERLDAITRQALDLPLPITPLDPDRTLWMLELFHGPTAAFKDFAARFLAGCLEQLRAPSDPVQTVLVATSGDTGAAVASAFHRKPGFRVVILFPEGRVAARQAHQLGAFGDNVYTFRVQGDFDDCQRMVKRLLGDPSKIERFGLTSANSISIGRLLPQISYYALASLRLGERVDVVVPTGNLGNALACVLVREMGFAIGTIYLATNANRTLPDYFSGGDYRGRPGVATLANAMDVGDPSNFERLAWLYRNRDPRAAGIAAQSFDDGAIREAIHQAWNDYRRAVCPHTACALEYARRLRRQGHEGQILIAATAHAAKFDNVVEPIIGAPVDPPPALAELLSRPSHAQPLPNQADALIRALETVYHD